MTCLPYILGVKLEYGHNQKNNDTVLIVDDIIGVALFYSTDRQDCCVDEFNIAGNWFLPNGSKMLSATNTQSLSIILGNQTVGLNITNSSEVPTGIYHCEIMDKSNVTYYLYVGIYTENEGIHTGKSLHYYNVMTVYIHYSIIIFYAGNITNLYVKYNKTSQTITCTSTGGPATEVIWSKNNEKISMMLSEGGLYENSQIIMNTTTYENWLRIIDKSSEAAGTYTCEVTNPRGSINKSLYIQGNK